MEYQKIKKLLDNIPCQPSKLRTMMTHVELTTPVVKVNLKFQF